MSLSLQNLRDIVRRALGNLDATDPDADDTVIDSLLNRSWWEIADKFSFREKEGVATLVTVIGTQTIPLPNDFLALTKLAYQDINNSKWSPVDPISKDDYDQKYINTVDERGPPEKYFRHNNVIYLWPTPDQVYTLNLWYMMTLADIQAGGVTIPQSWHEIISYGAIWRGHIEINGDMENSNKFFNIQINLLNSAIPVEAKEEIDRSRDGLQVIRRRYR